MQQRLTNTTERVVTAAVSAFREKNSAGDGLCTCAPCSADITALTLCTLPPHFCTGRKDKRFVREKLGNRVEGAVDQAAQRVASHPKHERTDDPHPSLKLVNFTLEEGLVLLDSLIREEYLSCSCDTCTSDILAYTLNRFPPKYGVERNGEVSLPRKQRDRLRQDMAFLLPLAVETISGRPRHG